MTISKWGQYPKQWGHGPIFKGSWRLQVYIYICMLTYPPPAALSLSTYKQNKILCSPPPPQGLPVYLQSIQSPLILHIYIYEIQTKHLHMVAYSYNYIYMCGSAGGTKYV